MRHPTASLSIGVWLAAALLIAPALVAPFGEAQSREPNRTLKLYFAHTGERGEFTFKRNGRYDRGELAKINRFLRDWRKNEPAKMDPQLLDLVWTIYKETGARDYIHVVSAYRSSGTNDMLRRRSSGVAKNSQHTQGKAMDFFIPGVPLDKLRAVAMKLQGGGVGYYPRSGSPFVHADTGNVRAWPRMSRQQLIALFPNGSTLHLPADGKPLPGYERALAQRKSGGSTQLAYLEADETTSASASGETGEKRGVGRWLKKVFDGGADQAEDDVTSETPIPTPPSPAEPATGDPEILIGSFDDGAEPRLPRARPGSEIDVALAELRPTTTATPEEQFATLAFAPLPRTRPDATVLAESLGGATSETGALNAPTEDAIAMLLGQMPQEPAPAAVTAEDDPVQLAFAAVEDASQPSEADRAIIAAFAAGAGASGSQDAALPQRTASAEALEETASLQAGATIGAIFSAADLVSTASAATSPAKEEAPAYHDDAGEMLDLIATTRSTGQAAKLAMPEPEGAPGLYAPSTATAEKGLAGEPELPVDRFAAAEPEKARSESFFSKLFSSLVQ